MATRAHVFDPTNRGGNAVVATWSGLLAGDDGAPFQLPFYADRSVQVQGDVGVGGTIVIEGSIDGTNYITLTDEQSTPLDFNGIGVLRAILQAVPFLRPRVTGGNGATNFIVSIFARG